MDRSTRSPRCGAGERGLTRYAVRRILQSIPLLLGILTLIFFLIHIAPGDPTTLYFNPNVPEAVREQMRHNMGLDQPLLVQYVRWMASFVRGDFGYSFTQFRPVASVIADTLPNTIVLGSVSLVLIFVLGCGVGAVQAVRPYSRLDRTLTFASLFIYSMPGFWLGLLLVIFFSSGLVPTWLQLPISGMTHVDYSFMGGLEKVIDRLRHLILPTIALGVASAAGVARYVRGEMLDVIHQDHVRTARAKGLPEAQVIRRHVLRNALIPIVSLLGLYLPLLIGGTVVIEVVFAWPGMGRLLFDAILARDYPLVLGASFLFALIVVAGNLLADLLYAVVDPRIRHA